MNKRPGYSKEVLERAITSLELYSGFTSIITAPAEPPPKLQAKW